MSRKLMIGLFALFCLTTKAQYVNLNKGAAQFKIPLYDYADPKSGLSTSISLDYISGSGFKVNEVASNVGQGWALNFGGLIQRIQVGEPDDQRAQIDFPPLADICNQPFPPENTTEFSGSFGGISWDNIYYTAYYPNGYLFSEFPISPNNINNPYKCAFPYELTLAQKFSKPTKYKQPRRVLADREQDIFIFAFNGRSGQFTIGKDGSFLVADGSKIKIQRVDEPVGTTYNRTSIIEFIITDENGVKYRFSEIERSLVMKSDLFNYESGGNTGIHYADIRSKPATNWAGYYYGYVIDKWYLKEIENPRTGEKISFTYNSNIYDYLSTYKAAYTKVLKAPGGFDSDMKRQTISLMQIRSYVRAKNISSIILPDGKSISFFYNAAGRADLNGSVPLTSVQLNYGNRVMSKWNLSYKYFFKKALIEYNDASSVAAADKRFLRLCLNSIQNFGVNAGFYERPYYFTYNTGSESNDDRYIVPPLRTFAQDHWGYYKNSDLVYSEIPGKYPLRDMMTNASLRNPTPGYASLGLLKQVRFPSKETLSYEYEQNLTLWGGYPYENIKNAGGVRVKKTASSNSGETTYEYIKENGVCSGWGGRESETYHYRINLTNVKNNNGNDSGGEQYFEFTNSIVQPFLQTVIMQNVVMPIAYSLIGNAANFFAPYLSYLLRNLFIAIEPTNEYFVDNYEYYPVWSINPIPLGYSSVIVKRPNINSGKIVYEFTSPGSQVLPFEFPFTRKPRMPLWKFNLLNRTIYRDNNNNMVKEEIIIYDNDLFQVPYVNPNYISMNIRAKHIYSHYKLNYYTPAEWSLKLPSEIYYPETNRVQVAKKIERNYGQSGSVSEVITDYKYNPINYQLQEVVTTKSNGEITGLTNYYSPDYNIPGNTLSAMTNANIFNAPVATLTWKKQSSNASKLLTGGTINEYAQLLNGDFKNIKQYAFELLQPVANPVLSEVFPKTNLLNYPDLVLQNTMNYNGLTGMPSYSISKSSQVSATLYDYNNRFAVATFINANTNEVAYNSFEAEGLGNFNTIDQSNIYEISDAVTGKKVLKLTGSALSCSNLNQQKKYTVSFWSKGNIPSVLSSGTGGITSSITHLFSIRKTVEEWKLYVAELQPGISGISFLNNTSGDKYIDEVRVYPADARISTTAYDPVYGKISECDNNNMIYRYLYDGMGRLVYVKDMYGSIVKMYDYKINN